MNQKTHLFLLIAILLTAGACTFSGILGQVFGSGGGIEKAPDIVATEIALPDDQSVSWSCTPYDLSAYLGDAWENNPHTLDDLKLEMNSSGDTLSYSLSFVHKGTFLVERDDDYHPPPGTTLISEGLYNIEEKYQGTGSAQRDGYIYQGKTKVDYQIYTYFPETQEQLGSIEFLTVGSLSQQSENLEICFDVWADQYEATMQDLSGLLRENCRWPGYYFVCYPDQ